MNIKIYKPYSLILAISFALVALLFLLIPNQVIQFFNSLSSGIGLPTAPLPVNAFYRILAVGYMYLVTCFAVQMYRFPHQRLYAALLAHAKLFSAMLSILFFIIDQPFLIYLCNAVIDGAIGLSALWSFRKLKQSDEP